MTDMTRDEALRRAIQAAEYGDRTAGADYIDAQARLALAWLAIHDRLPESDEPPGVEVQTGATEAWLPADQTARCGHDITSWRLGDHWVHPVNGYECDDPPVTRGS